MTSVFTTSELTLPTLDFALFSISILVLTLFILVSNSNSKDTRVEASVVRDTSTTSSRLVL